MAAAFLAVYLFWGATYLAIRVANETLPPLMMASARFLTAGAILYAWARTRAPRPTRAQWRSTSIVGVMLLLGGNGCVVWAESNDRVPSGIAALLVAMVSLWLVLIDWARRGGVRPTRGVTVGLALGFTGIGLLVGPAELAGGTRVDPIGAAVLAFASFSWAAGSIYSRHVTLPDSQPLTTAMEMLSGGAALGLLGLLIGEPGRFDPTGVSTRSMAALGYLIVFGSLIGFSAYVYILRVSTPARVGTYAFVNPVVAVVLGWAILGEPLTPRTLAAAAVIIAGVAAITFSRGGRGRTEPPPAADEPPRSAREDPAPERIRTC